MRLLLFIGICLLSSCITAISDDNFAGKQNHTDPNIDFRIIKAETAIHNKRYVMQDLPSSYALQKLSDNTYLLKIILQRDFKSSIRPDAELQSYFYYDGVELIFFIDSNHNQQLDKHDAITSRYIIGKKRQQIHDVIFRSDYNYQVNMQLLFDKSKN